MIEIFTICYNEEIILQKFINHYRTRFPNCEITIYDNMSTDNSRQIANATGYNIHAEAMSAIQKCKSRACFIDFDIDFPEDKKINLTELKPFIEENVGTKGVHYLRTRGGYHVLVEPSKIDKQFEKTWYKNMIKHPYVDIKGDAMIPVVGCTQGNFIPHFEK